MQSVDHTMTYAGASIEQVASMLADPAFRTRVLERQQTLSHDVSITPEGQGMRVRIEQVKPTEGVPAVAKKFVGDQTTVIQEEHWTSPTDATVQVTIPGQPGDLHGDVRLTETGGGVQERVQLEINVKIPLLGGKVERMLADLLSEALRVEESVGQEWLA